MNIAVKIINNGTSSNTGSGQIDVSLLPDFPAMDTATGAELKIGSNGECIIAVLRRTSLNDEMQRI